MQITFYVLNSKKASSDIEEAFLTFVCKLIQKVTSKANQTLFVLDDNNERLSKLDKYLWLLPHSFLPHELYIDLDHNISISDSVVPTILSNKLPKNFDGIVLNLSDKLLSLETLNDNVENGKTISPSRLLEIIPVNEINKEVGREKYRFYQNLGYQSQVHKVNI